MSNGEFLLVLLLFTAIFLPYQSQNHELDKSTFKHNILLGCYVNINTATIKNIVQLPGIGTAKAKRVIDGRPYTQEKDILRVRGIGAKTYIKIKPYIRTKDVPCDFTI